MSLDELMVRFDDKLHQTVLDDGYKGCDVIVMGQASAMKYVPETDNEVCISIVTTEWSGVPTVELNPKFKDILRLSFDDILSINHNNSDGLDEADARRAVEFFGKYVKTADKIIIHCFAGLSRSRSMAGTLCECFNLPFKYNIRNKNVYNMIYKAFQKYNGE